MSLNSQPSFARWLARSVCRVGDPSPGRKDPGRPKRLARLAVTNCKLPRPNSRIGRTAELSVGTGAGWKAGDTSGRQLRPFRDGDQQRLEPRAVQPWQQHRPPAVTPRWSKRKTVPV